MSSRCARPLSCGRGPTASRIVLGNLDDIINSMTPSPLQPLMALRRGPALWRSQGRAIRPSILPPPTKCRHQTARDGIKRQTKDQVRGSIREILAARDGESACRRDSVRCRGTWMTIHLVRSTRGCSLRNGAGRSCPLLDLAPGGSASRPSRLGRWCALTAPFHPCLCDRRTGSHRRIVFCCSAREVAPT
jgi:hypothetical protein